MNPFVKVIIIILLVAFIVVGMEWLLTDHVLHKFTNR